MTNIEFVQKLKDIATKYKTLYVMGCFGSPMTPQNKARFTNNHPYNRQLSRTKMINSASDDTFGFDCVCLIKAILWGWIGDTNEVYGGAGYAINGVPDIDADMMINICNQISNDFEKIEIGEVVWMKGHIGVYIGNGLVVECTPAWNNCVQITACNCNVKGYNRRNWKKHGKLPYINYLEEIKMFKDVPATHWAYKAIETLSDMGILEGYEDGTFKPEQPVTRAELSMVLDRYINKN